MKMKKKECCQRTRIVIRHLPPLSELDLLSQFDSLFSHRYNCISFPLGNSSQKHQTFSRAYIDFKSPGDVLEFADFFHGHTFVNEKGSQFKAIVEYAPSQRVPKPCTVKDNREGTIYRDPDYLEFLKIIAKPVENVPRTETQFEKKEAEQSAAVKESPITTPLMEYVRQKRAAGGGNQGPLAAVKAAKRGGSASANKPGSSATKRGAQKKKHILKSGTKNSNQKNMSASLMAPKPGDEPTILSGKEISEIESDSSVDTYVSRITLAGDSRKEKILLLKGKEIEISAVPGVKLQHSGNSPVSTSCKENQRFKNSERLIRSILLNNEASQSQSLAAVQAQHKFQKSSLKNDKRLPRPMNKRLPRSACKMKDSSSLIASEQKSSRRARISSYAVHQKQVWVQKSSSVS